MKKSPLDLEIISAAIIIGSFGFTLWSASSVFYKNHVQFYAENGFLENTQVLLLVFASIVFLATAALEKRSDKLILVFCFVLCIAFLLRELDMEDFDIPYALISIGSGVGRNTILAVAFASILIGAAFKGSHYKKAAVEFARSKPGWLLMAGGVFLWIGDFLEKNSVHHHHVFIEEMSEFFGYVLILLSSIASNSTLSGITSIWPSDVKRKISPLDRKERNKTDTIRLKS